MHRLARRPAEFISTSQPSAAPATGAQAASGACGFFLEKELWQRYRMWHVHRVITKRAIATMGDKIAAKAAVSAFGVPVAPGISRLAWTDDDLIASAPEVGPALVGPFAGAAVACASRHRRHSLPAAPAAARREAGAAFGDDMPFLNGSCRGPAPHRGSGISLTPSGNVIHLGERMQLSAGNQKVIEEALSLLTPRPGPGSRRPVRHRA